MECFIIEKGVERKAELEDILPLLGGIGLQYIFRDACMYVCMPYALAHLPDEMKNIVYGNLLLRIRGWLKKEVENAESKFKKDDSRIQNAREELISFIGKSKRFPYWYSNGIVWKEIKPKEPVGPVEELINDIEKACASGRLFLLSSYYKNKIPVEGIRNAFMAFQNRKDELKKIRSLYIDTECLPAVAMLFEEGAIDNLTINGQFTGMWHEFLENNRNLTSISLNVEGFNEFPAWIRNAVSLRHLSFERFDITLLPDWIGDMQSLTEIGIYYHNKNLKSWSDSICNLRNLAKLSVYGSGLKKLPDSIGNLISLKELDLYGNNSLISLPDSIGNLMNLVKLNIDNSPFEKSAFEKLPDSIGNLIYLKELSLFYNDNLTSLPDSISNLNSLTEFYLCSSPIKELPDWIGNLQNLAKLSLNRTEIEKLPESIGSLGNLTELSLENCKNLKCLPDSIGRLKNLAMLNLCGSGIEKLPDTIADCSSLECLDIRKTSINSFPDFISSIKELKKTIEVMPKKCGISYLSFCNYYYTLADTIIMFSEKARREGLLALEDEIDNSISDGFFREGISLVVYGTDGEIVQHILTLKIERESDPYKKKLMQIALEGILCILRGDRTWTIFLKLAAMVDIKNNPIDAACAKYLIGDYDAFVDIDLRAAIQPEEEREEIRFIKRAFEINKIYCREGILGIEQLLDNNGIAARDIFEYGLSLLVVGLDYKDIDNNLTMLIAHETDPVRKNFSLAKKDAVRMIYEGNNPGLTEKTLLAYFDDDVAEFFSELDD